MLAQSDQRVAHEWCRADQDRNSGNRITRSIPIPVQRQRHQQENQDGNRARVGSRGLQDLVCLAPTLRQPQRCTGAIIAPAWSARPRSARSPSAAGRDFFAPSPRNGSFTVQAVNSAASIPRLGHRAQ